MKTDNEARKPKNFEEILDSVGSFNRYQFFLYFVFSLAYVGLSANNLFMAFGNLNPSWKCMDKNFTDFNDSLQEFGFNCRLKSMCQSQLLRYKREGKFYSVVEQFDLLCDRKSYSALIISIQMMGLFLGTLAGGQLADSFGRKFILTLFVTFELAIGFASAFAPNWQSYAVFRFVIGFFAGGHLVTGFTYIVENIGEKHRFKIKPIGIGPASQIWFSVLAYFIHDWKVLSMVANAQSVLAIPLLMFAAHESPRWLLQRGRVEDAEKVLRKIANFNGFESPPTGVLYSFQETVSDSTESPGSKLNENHIKNSDQTTVAKNNAKRYYFWHLFSTKKLTVFSTVMAINWFTASCISYGLNFNIKNLSFSPQFTLGAFGLFGWLAMLFALFLDVTFAKIGRKIIHCYSLAGPFLCFLSVVIYQVVTGTKGEKLNSYMTALVVVGDSINQGLWLTVYQLSAELFPTVVRNIAGGFCSAMARVAAVVVPYMFELSDVWKPLPYIFLATGTLTCFLLSAAFLEETKGKPLQETIKKDEKLSYLKF